MNITNDMIHPQLRNRGEIIRKVLPYFKPSTFKKANRSLKLMKGRGSKKLNYEQIFIPRPDNTSLRLCIYSPKKTTEKRTGLLWNHGGGYGLGIPEQDEQAFIKQFVLEHQCVVVAPDYRLSTEAPYPAAIDDCYTALCWMKNNVDYFNIRENQLMVGGDSAGGGLTAALCIMARDKGQVSVAFQMPLYPMLDDRMITPSSQNNDAPVWNTLSNENGWQMYLQEDYQSLSLTPYAAPSRLLDFSNLPPAFTYVGTIEPFRDETIDYMESLRDAGVSVSYELFEGCYHAFDIIASQSKPAKKAKELLSDHLYYAQENYLKEQPS